VGASSDELYVSFHHLGVCSDELCVSSHALGVSSHELGASSHELCVMDLLNNDNTFGIHNPGFYDSVLASTTSELEVLP